MILVILAVMIVLIGVGLWMSDSCVLDVFGWVLAFIGAIGAIISFIAFIIMLINVSNLKVIDERIAMYEEENAAIEAQIEAVVKQYQEYETEVFSNAKGESAITLVSLYPELKSDTLVQSQIDIYMANKNQIVSLKDQAIRGEVTRWWVYFG